MTLPGDTRSPAASVSSPAGPCLRCHRGDTLRIAALTPGGILYVRNYFFLTPKHTHIITHTQTVTRDHSYIRSHTLLRLGFNFFEPLSRCGLMSNIALSRCRWQV